MFSWFKQTSTIVAQKSVAVLSFEGQKKYQTFEKVCMETAAISFTQNILSAEFVLCCWALHLFYLQISFITMPQEARKGNLEVEQASGPASWPCKPVFWVFTVCKQTKTRGTKWAFILGGVRSTVAQSSFHTEFLSSIRFSPLRFLRRRKRTNTFLAWRTKAKLVNNKS